MNIDEKLGGKDSGQDGKGNSEPIKARLFEWLRDHPNERSRGFLRKAARAIKVDYDSNCELLWKYSSEYKTSVFSLPLNGVGSTFVCCSKPEAQHACFAELVVPDCLSRVRFPEVSECAVAAGWRLSRNSNHALIWDVPFGREGLRLGRIQWHVNGYVQIHVLKPQTVARVKQLLYSAFITTGLILDRDIGEGLLGSWDWDSSHDVYFTDRRLPYKKITAYASLGVKKIVTGDNSHRKAIEVEVAKPEIVKKYEKLVSDLADIVKSQDKRNTEKDVQIAKLIETNNNSLQQFNEYIEDISGKGKFKGPDVPRGLYE